VDEAREARFAIAVRDGNGLWLFLWLKRNRRGDVYLFWPIKEEGRNPHASYHRDGRTHHKSFNKPLIVRRRQKPDAAFSGTEQIVTTPIYHAGVRALNEPCRREDYPGGVFELSAEEISPTLQDCRTALAVDLVSPGAPPLIHPQSSLLRRAIFTDAIPHISLTLWDQSKVLSP